MEVNPDALKTLAVMPKGHRPSSWTIADQLQLDQRVKQEEITRRQSKKELHVTSDSLPLPS